MGERVLHYSTQKAIQAQVNYCAATGQDFIAPGYGTNGCCPVCHNPIYIIGGVSIEEAESTRITGCPYCKTSYLK